MKILIAGDYCDSFRVTDVIARKEYGALFDNVRDIISSADYSIVNFEFPIVAKEGNPIAKCGPNLKGQPASVEAIKYAGFRCCTLANNHILDQGEACLLDTKNRLEEAGIKTVGAGANLSEASEILYIDKDGKKVAIINCCEHEFSIATETSSGANPLNPIRQYYKIQKARKNADYVLIIVHGGHEHYQLPSPRMKETYRFFVDNGADAVVNHHQHCYSGYEIYKGKPIFYGIGNFLFDWEGKRNTIWNEGYMVELLFEETISCQLIPYVQCAEKATIELMIGDKKKKFESLLIKLNEIICDDEKLKATFIESVKQKSRTHKLIFTPYSNPYLRAMTYRGFLPSFLNNKKILELINYIGCESNRDISLPLLQRLIK